MALLTINDLHVWIDGKRGVAKVVNGVTLVLEKGSILGLVGESGSGKSITNLALMGLLPPLGRIVSGSINYQGVDLTKLTEKQWKSYRGRKMAMIFQDPLSTLNPVYTVGKQMAEAIRVHQPRASRVEMRSRSLAMLELVGISSPQERLAAYPHQLSGGMNQRVVIAIALLNRPELILADEPTTALDVTIQSQIIFKLKELVAQLGVALIWVSHDLATVAGLCDQVCVMYAGRIMERGTVEEVITHPRHPYTRALLNCDPSRNSRGQPLKQISGQAPSFFHLPPGCPFAPRCPQAGSPCQQHVIPLRQVSATHTFSCQHTGAQSE